MLVAVATNRDDVVQAQRLATVLVNIRLNGVTRQVRTAQTTVGETLREAGIEVGPLDVVTPSVNAKPCDKMSIGVVKVREVEESVKVTVDFVTVRKFTKSLRPGMADIIAPGVKGEKLVHYRTRYEDGKAVKKTVIGSEVTKQPEKRIISVGSRGFYTSRGEFQTRRVMNLLATAYDPGPRSCGKWRTGRTNCGLRAGYGVVAVDPRVIPLGSKLYVEGYGYALAGDTGPAIKGKRIDLGYDSYGEARRFGRRWVSVHILQQ